MEEEIKYTVSQHAKERYSERIMEKDTRVSVVQFMTDHDDKIVEDINKMIIYGQLLYSGKSLLDPKFPVTIDIYNNGLWVVIVDKNKNHIITLYKIDLGAGDDLNKEFYNILMKQLNSTKEEYENKSIQHLEEIDNIKDEIEQNNLTIADYKRRIKLLEEINESKKAQTVVLNHQIELAENNIRDVIAKMIGKKVF